MEVFTKSAPAAWESTQPFTFSSSVSSAVSRMTLTSAPPRVAGRDHARDVALDQPVVAGLQRADVDDHVDFAGPFRDHARRPRRP